VAPCHDLGVAGTPLRAEPVRVVLDSAALEDLARRLRAARITPDPGGTWARGTPPGWLAELVADWQAFDAQALQARLDQLTHLRVEVNGVAVHVVHAPGTGRGCVPLLLTHGWPSSFLEYSKLLPLLTDPSTGGEGGTPADAFTVVAPSLPGFGFSGPPPAGGLTHAEVAEMWYRIMTEALGYQRFVAHGSDLGAGVTARLARSHPDAVAAIHLATPGLAAPPQPWSDAVADHFREAEHWSAEEGGYAHMHATKPATIGAALDDSPVALAAWVGEKLTRWSSTTPDGRPAFDRDQLLSTLTLYWTTRTAASSLLPYWAHRHARDSALPADDPASAPTAIDIFGGEIVPFPKPPRELAERYFNVVHWAEHGSGGHFPAVAEPRLLAQRLRAAFQPYGDREA
jgi:pimeloyl-ACP methyl ester carboxylesterase